MIRLRLTHGLSHDNGLVSATQKNPIVTVEDEAAARFCVDSGFFEIIGNDESQPTVESRKEQPKAAAASKPVSVENAVRVPSAPDVDGAGDDADELDAMTVTELRNYADMTGVDLGKLTKKGDIIDAIRKAEAE